MKITTIDRKKAILNSLTTKMAFKCERMMKDGLKALYDLDGKKGKDLAEEDKVVDGYYSEIEGICLKTMLLDHPVAGDFLFISSTLKMITDFERIGDYAVDIGEEASFLAGRGKFVFPARLKELSDAVMNIVEETIQSYVNLDANRGARLDELDDKVDVIFASLKDEILFQDGKKENAIFMLVSKYLERVADHCVNIGEWITYLETGSRK